MLTVTFTTWYKFDYPEQKLKKMVKSVCRRFGLSNATIGIVIIDNEQSSKINEKFLHRKKTTDCLSFDFSEMYNSHSRKLFELLVNGQKAISEAKKRRHSPQAELALYITHGLLHNLGFDDLTAKKAKLMHQMEDEILQQHGFGIVFENHISKPSPKNAD